MASNPIEPTIFTGNVAIIPNEDNPELGTGCLDVSDILYTDKIQEYNNDAGVNLEDVFFQKGRVTITSTEDATTTGTGACIVNGGLSIAKSLYVGDTLTVAGTAILPPSPGSIAGQSFSILNHQTIPQHVTGLSFDPAAIRAAIIHVSISIQASQNLFALAVIKVVQGASKWYIATDSAGDPTNVFFFIDEGQVSYTSDNYPGFTSGVLQFIATTFVR